MKGYNNLVNCGLIPQGARMVKQRNNKRFIERTVHKRIIFLAKA